jgi:hypothetical protein
LNGAEGEADGECARREGSQGSCCNFVQIVPTISPILAEERKREEIQK